MFDCYYVRAEGEGLLSTKVKGGGKQGKGISKKRMNKGINDAIANLVKTQLPNAIKSVVEPMLEGLKPAKPTSETKPDDAPLGDVKGLSPEANALLRQQKAQIDELTKTLRAQGEESKSDKARAEAAERNGAIDAAMNEFVFASPQARESARKLISLEVKRSDDGALIGGENLPLGDFVKEALTKQHDYFLATAEVGGAGASKGVTRNSAGVGIETIKKGMTEQERLAVTQEIGRAIQAANVQY